MNNDDDIEGLAAEYALGSLSPSLRRAVDERRRYDYALDENIKAWERRLAPLGHRSADVEPPTSLYSAVLSRIEAPKVSPFKRPKLAAERNQRGWAARGLVLTGAAVGLAACLLLAIALIGHPRISADPILVAQLHGIGNSADTSEVPAFAAVVDPTAGTMTVRPIDVHPIAEKKYTLWLVQQPTAPPISLGTVSPSLPATLTWPMNPQIDEFVNFTVAISLEPEERDTGAVPTGPFAFAGKLIGSEGSRGG